MSGDRKTLHRVQPDPEVPEKKRRRKFTAKYKLSILSEADLCVEPGQLGALLRREGLYSSHLTTWRRQRQEGLLDALSPKKRGRKKKPKNPLVEKVARLERDNRRLQQKLKQTELIIEAQKKCRRAVGNRTKPGLVLGYNQAQRAGQVDLLLSLCDHGHLQSLCCRLDDRPA